MSFSQFISFLFAFNSLALWISVISKLLSKSSFISFILLSISAYV